ncbi:aldolase [Halorarum halophilum]|uniref:Aldolase n=1 Tax=Halorarum halophilum TaxID=2743090 RepID=A0A7D5L2P8_9EURY|nr:aldolase/citrate lyase family protein [Halobaculum halophilum]QLG27283.1 aldolase [Halobaculum halophilum]
MSRENKVRERLESGGNVLGARAETMSPVLVEVYGRLGYDFVWLDFEHAGASPYDSTALDPLVRAAESTDIELLVRVPHGEPPLVHKVLDAGVSTLLVPRVESADQVERAVRAARFEFDGEPGDRGWGGGRPTAWGADAENFTERQDEQVLVGAMIESAAAVADVEEILSVPHLGFAFIGANDLSVSLGHPQETDHPEVVDAIERIESACLDANVPFGAPKHDTDAAAAALEDGYSVLRVGDEVGSVREVLGDRLEALR